MLSSENSQVEIYPMPAFPTHIVSDIEASSRWYSEALGFTNEFTMPGPEGIPTLVHLRWAKYADLLLFPDRSRSLVHVDKGVGVALNFSTADFEDKIFQILNPVPIDKVLLLMII